MFLDQVFYANDEQIISFNHARWIHIGSYLLFLKLPPEKLNLISHYITHVWSMLSVSTGGAMTPVTPDSLYSQSRWRQRDTPPSKTLLGFLALLLLHVCRSPNTCLFLYAAVKLCININKKKHIFLFVTWQNMKGKHWLSIRMQNLIHIALDSKQTASTQCFAFTIQHKSQINLFLINHATTNISLCHLTE